MEQYKSLSSDKLKWWEKEMAIERDFPTGRIELLLEHSLDSEHYELADICTKEVEKRSLRDAILDLTAISDKLDKVLHEETNESLSNWLNNKRKQK